MQCDDGTKASGTLNGSSLTFSSTGLQCSADVSSGTGGSPGASGSCRSSQGTCSFDAACASGACTHPNDLQGDSGPKLKMDAGIHGGGGGSTGAGGTSGTPPAPRSGGSTGVGGATGGGASSGTGGKAPVAADAGTHRSSGGGSGGAHP
jgi:hypothetical protein